MWIHLCSEMGSLQRQRQHLVEADEDGGHCGQPEAERRTVARQGWSLCKKGGARISPEAKAIGKWSWREARGNHRPGRWQWRLTGATETDITWQLHTVCTGTGTGWQCVLDSMQTRRLPTCINSCLACVLIHVWPQDLKRTHILRHWEACPFHFGWIFGVGPKGVPIQTISLQDFCILEGNFAHKLGNTW